MYLRPFPAMFSGNTNVTMSLYKYAKYTQGRCTGVMGCRRTGVISFQIILMHNCKLDILLSRVGILVEMHMNSCSSIF